MQGNKSTHLDSKNLKANSQTVPASKPTNISQLEDQINNYDRLSQAKKKDVRDKIKRAVVKQQAQFEKKIKDFFSKNKNKFSGLNLIAGTTGSGKSTVFNYTQGFHLIVQKDKNREGTAILKLDEKFIKKNPRKIYSLIGEGFVSKTTYPIFAMGEGKDYIDVDLPGQFDNKDFLQSIINALLRIRVCQLAPQIKLTIVVSYNQLNNRATAFKKTVGEIQKFIGNWKNFHPLAVCLAITQVPSQLNDLLVHVKNRLKEIAEYQAKDLGQFNIILEAIIKSQAYGIMPTPRLKIKPKTIIGNKHKPKEGLQQEELVVAVGQIYSPQKDYCSPQLLNKKIGSLQYMKIYEGLICPGIKSESMQILEDICFSLLGQLKEEHLEKMKEKVKKMNRKALEQNRQIMRHIVDLGSLRKVFSIKEDFLASEFKDLSYFLKLTKIKDVDRQLLMVKKDVEMLISQRINDLDEEQRKKQQKKQENMEEQQQRLRKLQELRSRLRQIEQQLNISEKTRSKQQKLSKEEMKKLEDEWFQLRDEISDKQYDSQKQERNELEKFDGLRVQSDDENLQSEDLRIKKKEIQKQQSSCNKKLDIRPSKGPVYSLVLRRRIEKLNEALKKMQQIKQKKKQELASNEESIQDALNQIMDWKGQEIAAKKQADKAHYQDLITDKREDRQRLQEEWYKLKDYKSDLQDEEQKRQRQSQYQQFDEDLWSTDEHKLKYEELKEKILRMRQKRSNLKQIKDSIQEEQKKRLQFLKINRRRRKLLKKIQLCKQIQKEIHSSESQQNSDDS